MGGPGGELIIIIVLAAVTSDPIVSEPLSLALPGPTLPPPFMLLLLLELMLWLLFTPTFDKSLPVSDFALIVVVPLAAPPVGPVPPPPDATTDSFIFSFLISLFSVIEWCCSNCLQQLFPLADIRRHLNTRLVTSSRTLPSPLSEKKACVGMQGTHATNEKPCINDTDAFPTTHKIEILFVN